MEEQIQQPTPQPEKLKKKFHKKWWFWVIVGLLVVSVVMGYFLIIKGEGNSASVNQIENSNIENTGNAVNNTNEFSSDDSRTVNMVVDSELQGLPPIVLKSYDVEFTLEDFNIVREALKQYYYNGQDFGTTHDLDALLHLVETGVDKKILTMLGYDEYSDQEIEEAFISYYYQAEDSIENIKTELLLDYNNTITWEQFMKYFGKGRFYVAEYQEIIDSNVVQDPAFDALLSSRFEVLYDAFVKGLEYTGDSYCCNFWQTDYFDAHAMSLSGFVWQDWPELLREELIKNIDTLLDPTGIYESNGYYYFGMASDEAKSGSVDDIYYRHHFQGVRFPGWQAEIVYYQALLDNGVLDGSIQVIESEAANIPSVTKLIDEDEDGLTDYIEYAFGTDDVDEDTDDDGYTDKEEFDSGNNPFQ